MFAPYIHFNFEFRQIHFSCIKYRVILKDAYCFINLIIDRGFFAGIQLQPRAEIPETVTEHADKEAEEVDYSFVLRFSHDTLSDFFPSQNAAGSSGTEEAVGILSAFKEIRC